MLTKVSILSSVTLWQVFCNYVRFNASSESRGNGGTQDRCCQTNNHLLAWLTGSILAGRKVCTDCKSLRGEGEGREGVTLFRWCTRIAIRICLNAKLTQKPKITCMIRPCYIEIALHLRNSRYRVTHITYRECAVPCSVRPTLLSAPQPHSSSSSFTAVQLWEGSLQWRNAGCIYTMVTWLRLKKEIVV